MSATLRLAARYAAALAAALAWSALLAVACRVDRGVREAVAAGERIDRVDDAYARLDALHAGLFGSDE